MAKQMTDEQIAAYKDKPATDVAIRFADWMIEKLGLEFKSTKDEALYREAVRQAVALRMIFQASPENQDVRGERREERESAAEAKAEKKASAKAAKAEPKAEESKPAKAPAKKAAKAAKPAPVDTEDEGDTATAAPAKPAKPAKKAARTGAAAPF